MNAQKPIGCWQLIPGPLRYGDVSTWAEKAGTRWKRSCSHLFMCSFGLDLAEWRTTLLDTFEAAFPCTMDCIYLACRYTFPFWCHYSTMTKSAWPYSYLRDNELCYIFFLTLLFSFSISTFCSPGMLKVNSSYPSAFTEVLKYTYVDNAWLMRCQNSRYSAKVSLTRKALCMEHRFLSLFLLLTSCVTPGKFLSLSEPHVPHQYTKETNFYIKASLKLLYKSIFISFI